MSMCDLVLLNLVFLAALLPSPLQSASAWQEIVATSDEAREQHLYPIEEFWEPLPAASRRQIDQAIQAAYPVVSEHGSSDSVLIDEDLRQKFLDATRVHLASLELSRTGQAVDSAVLVWRLLSLRKAGKLPMAAGRRPNPPLADRDRLVAEIASRRSEDQFQRSLDRILVDDHGRAYFDSVVQQIANELDLNQVRRAALALRKTRQLRPELSARLVDWPIDQRSYRYPELKADLKLAPEKPGIYLFRDQTGYLYIGEAKNLRARLMTHFTDSDREALFHYLQQPDTTQVFVDLHVFPTDSPGATLSVRRAYESELIRSRHPKFNLRP